jgi:hypothetical protein
MKMSRNDFISSRKETLLIGRKVSFLGKDSGDSSELNAKGKIKKRAGVVI